MRKFSLILVSLICIGTARSQPYSLDSIRNLLAKNKADTNALKLMNNLAYGYVQFHPDSTYYFGRQEFLLARQLNNFHYVSAGLLLMSIGFRQMGNYPKALEYALRSLKISEQKNLSDILPSTTNEISSIYYF